MKGVLICTYLCVHPPTNIRINIEVVMFSVQYGRRDSVTHDIFSSLPSAVVE
jgi:hypothetical protein